MVQSTMVFFLVEFNCSVCSVRRRGRLIKWSLKRSYKSDNIVRDEDHVHRGGPSAARRYSE